MMQHVFIIGSKSMGAYGGYETFVNKLTEYHSNNKKIKYHVACKANGDGSMDESKLEGAVKINDAEFEYHNAHCFKIHVPNIGPACAVYYDIAALKYCCKYIKENKIENPIVYILACRIGPFIAHYRNMIHKAGGKVYLNPDGHEWLRAKWSPLIRKYWKMSEKMMIKNCDLAICDSINIEKYILDSYAKYNPKTTFVAYGADTTKSVLHLCDEKVVNWYKEKDVTPKNYYLVVGRFVPENNYETMIKEFMKSDTDKDFVIITNVEGNAFYENLRKTTNFESDPRIKFVGTVYDQELLKKIREDAYAYFHGHEVGGTNPSLLEALAITDLNLLLDVGFNREVGEDGALYWSKEENSLSDLINSADAMSEEEIDKLSLLAKQRINDCYSWEYIVNEYEKVFLN